jgi:hypothetical protein
LTTHSGIPEVRCELAGAFAFLKLVASGVYVPGARFANATPDPNSATSAAAVVTRLVVKLDIEFSYLRSF